MTLPVLHLIGLLDDFGERRRGQRRDEAREKLKKNDVLFQPT